MDDNNDLAGIPGLGPVRRTALLAAGITGRAELRKSSADQIVAMTGMGRAPAERLVTFLAAAAEGKPTAVPSVAAGGDEAMPGAKKKAADKKEAAPPREAVDMDATDTDVSEFDRVLFAARTALSDATRTFAGTERLQKPFVRLARRLDAIEDKKNQNTLVSGRRKRIQKRLLILTVRLEKAAIKTAPLSPKREDRLRERVQNESRALTNLMVSAKVTAPKTVSQKPTFKPSKNAKK